MFYILIPVAYVQSTHLDTDSTISKLSIMLCTHWAAGTGCCALQLKSNAFVMQTETQKPKSKVILALSLESVLLWYSSFTSSG